MISRLCIAILFSLAATAVCSGAPGSQAQVQTTNDKKTAADSASEKPVQPAHEEEGQRIFEVNCSRCHATPEGFSSRISNTIVRHMRIRASLSAHDEQELRRFFNP